MAMADLPTLSDTQPRDGYLLPIVACALIAVCAFVAGVGVNYPTSDLDGHIAAIELYRNAFSEGVLWPFDRFTGFGEDAVPYYSWPLKYTLGIIAYLLGKFGISEPSQVAVQSMVALSCTMLPLAMSWSASQALFGFGPHAKWWAKQGGAIGALAWLSLRTHEGITGYGITAINMGLSYQIVGWVFFILTIGAACRCARIYNDRGRFHFAIEPMLTICIALLATSHTMSLLSSFIILSAFLLYRPMVFIPSCAVGLLLAFPSIYPIIYVGDRLAQTEWMHTWKYAPACDPITAVIGSIRCQPSILWLTSVVGVCAMIGFCFLYKRWSTLPIYLRCLLSGAALLEAAIIVPTLTSILPGNSQPYRMHALILLLIICVGLGWFLLIFIKPLFDHRHKLTRFIAASSIMVWLTLGLYYVWPQPDDDEPWSVGNELSAVIPRGSRVLALDGNTTWHRQFIDRWAQRYGWMAISGFNHPVASPANVRASAVATGLGYGLNNIFIGAYRDRGTCIKELQDLGFTHVIRRVDTTDDFNSSDFGGLNTIKLKGFVVSAVPNPKPFVEAIAGTIITARSSDLGRWRMLAAWWWGISSHEVDFHLSRIAVTDSPPPGWTALDRTLIPDVNTCDYLNTIYRAWAVRSALAYWNTLAKNLTNEIVRLSESAHVPPSASANIAFSWINEHTLSLSGLMPGQPYLIRLSHSNRSYVSGGDLYEEIGGFTILVPANDKVVISTNKGDFILLMSMIISALTICVCMFIFLKPRR